MSTIKKRIFEGIFIALLSGVVLLAVEYYVIAPSNTFKREGTLNNNVDTKTTRGIVSTELHSILNNPIHTDPNRRNLVLYVKSNDQPVSFEIEAQLEKMIETDKINVILKYFKESFKDQGLFDRVFKGDLQIVQQLGIFPSIDYLVLGDLEYSFRSDRQVNQDLLSCDIKLSYVIVDKSHTVLNSNMVYAIGPGFDKNSALKRGIEMIAEKCSSAISTSIN